MDDKQLMERACRVWLWEMMGVGSVRFNKWLSYFNDSATLLWQSSVEEWQIHLGTKAAVTLSAWKKKRGDPERHLVTLNTMGIGVLVRGMDELYPVFSSKLVHPPEVVYYRGVWQGIGQPCVAVVGTRKPTAHGIEMTQEIVRALVHNGYIVVSGLAIGIDGIAHRTCVESGGRTIGWLASGIDQITPREHEQLARQMCGKGAVLSAFAPGQPAFRGNFVARNELVAAMCEAVVVPEGRVNSGTWLTAEFGLSMGKQVFAVPGSMNSVMSEGPLQLTKKGGILLTSISDLLESLSLAKKSAEKGKKVALPVFATELEQQIGEVLVMGPIGADELIKQLGKPAAEVMKTLTYMELSGFVSQMGSGWSLVGV